MQGGRAGTPEETYERTTKEQDSQQDREARLDRQRLRANNLTPRQRWAPQLVFTYMPTVFNIITCGDIDWIQATTTTITSHAVGTAQRVLQYYASFSYHPSPSNNLFNVLVAFERSSLISMLFKSCHIVCIQAAFGLPRGLFTFLRYSSRVFLAGVSGCSRIRCPSHVSGS